LNGVFTNFLKYPQYIRMASMTEFREDGAAIMLKRRPRRLDVNTKSAWLWQT
jgi:hypothetical protein